MHRNRRVIVALIAALVTGAGYMATCKSVQCYNLCGGGTDCETPSCDGTYCMF